MPLPSTRQSHMDVHIGKTAAVNDDYIADDLAFLFNVVAKVAAYTCLTRESGTFFTTEGATAAVTFTLPAVASSENVCYWFGSMEDFAMTITAPAGTLVCGNNAAATSVSFETADNIIAGAFMVVCDGTLWYAFPMRPQGDATITVA